MQEHTTFIRLYPIKRTKNLQKEKNYYKLLYLWTQKMLLQPSCNVRFHLTWFNIDSLPHANRTTWHYIEVASDRRNFYKSARQTALIYFRIRYTFTSIRNKTNFHGEVYLRTNNNYRRFVSSQYRSLSLSISWN